MRLAFLLAVEMAVLSLSALALWGLFRVVPPGLGLAFLGSLWLVGSIAAVYGVHAFLVNVGVLREY